MTAPLRVGVIGVGGIAQMMHLPTLAERPDLFAIGAIADVSEKTLAAVGDRYHVATRVRDYRDLLGRADLDALLVFTSGCHRDALLEIVKSDKHVFVEKPVAYSLKETEEVAAAARGRRGQLMVGYHKRFDPAWLRARDAVRGMRELRYVEVTVLHPDDAAARTHHAVLPTPEKPWSPRAEAEIDGGLAAHVATGAGAGCVDLMVGKQAPADHRLAAFILFDSLIHDVSAVRGILGDPERVLSAHAWRGGMAQTSVTLVPKDVRVVMSWISLPGVRLYEERLRFVSPEMRVTLTFPSPYLKHFPTPLLIERMDGTELVAEQRTVSYEEAFRAELHHFRACVAEGRPASPSIDDALGDARWIQQIAEAYGPR
jgi:predicted dehydrogenase